MSDGTAPAPVPAPNLGKARIVFDNSELTALAIPAAGGFVIATLARNSGQIASVFAQEVPEFPILPTTELKTEFPEVGPSVQETDGGAMAPQAQAWSHGEAQARPEWMDGTDAATWAREMAKAVHKGEFLGHRLRDDGWLEGVFLGWLANFSQVNVRVEREKAEKARLAVVAEANAASDAYSVEAKHLRDGLRLVRDASRMAWGYLDSMKRAGFTFKRPCSGVSDEVINARLDEALRKTNGLL